MVEEVRRVAVAMSGGVDSSVAAALLVEQGYEVIGVMMRLWSPEGVENRCCAPEALEGARRVCQTLGIPFYPLNFEEEFRHYVVDYFQKEYAQGRTPNPCLECNRHLKFRLLRRKALAWGTSHLSTGHYARIGRRDGLFRLLKARDEAKDQSYALYMLGQEELSQLLFPLGERTKGEVRSYARKRGLPVAEREESQELCFAPEGDYRRFLRDYTPLDPQPGPILDFEGRLLGEHQGLAYYTVGQRRGLGLAVGQPLYVLHLDPERNALIVGDASHLGCSALWAKEVSYVIRPPFEPLEVMAKVRYKAEAVPALLTPLDGGSAHLAFRQPPKAVAPGQGVVFYRGEEVLGGGIIEEGA